jgi:menaquinone-dependent protoporphyrinogen oxidase
MTVLILYATTEGQTRKIAGRAGDHLKLRGKEVEVIQISGANGLDLSRFERVILMASVHAGRYQPEFLAYVTLHKVQMDKVPNAFLSVSLSAASTDPEDLEGIAACVAKMTTETEWSPEIVVHVAGAFRFAQYDFLKSWAMRWIAAKRDPTASTKADTEYTDWEALYGFLDSWAA